MERIPENEFFEWLNGVGIALDRRYGPPQCLVFASQSSHSRFWSFPESPRRWPFLFSEMLSGLGDWTMCTVWPRGGRWPYTVPGFKSANPAELMRDSVFSGL